MNEGLNLDTFYADHPELRPPEEMVRPLTFLSVCDGMGCASLAFNPLGWRQVLSSEIEAAPQAVLGHRLGAHDMRRSGGGRLPLWGDMAALRIRHLRRFGIDLPDLLCGGTPCQGFSVAGLRGGMTDPRGALTLTFIRLANALDAARHDAGQPPIVIFWENVPGILSMPGNPFGHVLAGLVGEDTPVEPVRGRWTDAGLAIGPRRAAAWRILDAQYFGLAQRRERLFVVASARDGFDPAAVLFEPEGVRRHSPPSRKAGQGVAPTIAGGARKRGGFSYDDIPLAEAFGGNDTRGPIDVATCLSSHGGPHGGPHGRLDFESETFVVAPDVSVAIPIMESGKRTGASTTSVKAGDGLGADGDPMFTLGADSRHAVAFALRTNQTGANGCNISEEVAYPLCADEQPCAIAFDVRQTDVCVSGDVNQALDTKFSGPAIAFALRGRENGAVPEVEGDGQAVGALRAASGGSSRDYIAFQGRGSNIDLGQDVTGTLSGNCDRGSGGAPCVAQTYGVRRLTPTECERLQGVPDGYTLVPHRGKPMADGPRYKMLGNGWAVPVIQWIGERIAAEVELSSLQTVDRDGQAGRAA